jgi:electron transfer flavoprotein beta subunit
MPTTVKIKERTFAFLLTSFPSPVMVLFMKILVCVKQVPESETPILIDDDNARVKSDKICDFKMNRLDEFAVEEALLIKAAFSDTKIDALSAGPERSREVIRRSIGMGADAGIHIRTESRGYHSSYEIAAWIAEYARGEPYDLILTGAMSEDNMQGQVGPMIAKQLSRPWATAVIFEKIASDRKTIYIEREIEGGQRDTLELPLPAVLTIQSGINTPRYPSLSNLLRANRQGLKRIDAADLEQHAAREKLVELVYPRKTRSGTVLIGTQEEKATQLIRILRERALLP